MLIANMPEAAVKSFQLFSSPCVMCSSNRLYVCVCARVCVHVCVCARAVCVCVHVCVHTHVYTHACMHVCYGYAMLYSVWTAVNENVIMFLIRENFATLCERNK